MTCNHTSSRWVMYPHCDPDDPTTTTVSRFEQYPTTVDIDTHRYRCTKCKQIMYYSKVARDFYEHGIPSEVPGLG